MAFVFVSWVRAAAIFGTSAKWLALAEKGGQAVDFRLETKDGKVSLKAKIVK